MGPLLFAVAPVLAAGLRRAPEAPTPRSRPPSGVVVDSADENSPPAIAGVRAGDVLVGWERAANPPANAAPARGVFTTPMDVEDVCLEEADRGKLTLVVFREGKSLPFRIPTGYWDAFELLTQKPQLKLRPVLDKKSLEGYLEGLSLSQGKDGEQGYASWRALARDWSSLGAPGNAVWLSLTLGMSLDRAHRLDEAQKAFEAALSEARALGMGAATKTILAVMGKSLFRQHHPERAAEAWEEIIRLQTREGRPSLWVARALAQRANIEWRAGKPAEGLELFREAVEICEKAAPGGLYHAAYLSNSGSCALDLGDVEAAERYDRAALAIMERLRLGDERRPMTVNLGNVLLQRGDLAGAEEFYRDSLAATMHASPGTHEESTVTSNLGTLAMLRGDLAAAESYFLRTLAIEEKIDSRSDYTAQSLSLVGDVYAARGDLATAESFYRRSLQLIESLYPEGLKVVDPLDGLGRLSLRRGDPAAASAYLERALLIREKTAPGGLDTATTLNALGEAAAAAGQLDRARTYHLRALDLLEKSSPDSVPYAETLHDLGVLDRKGGHLREAADELRRAVDALESEKQRLGGTEETRSLFAAGHADFYRDYLEVLIELGRKEDAFRTLERSRARALLALLAERDLVFAADVPPEFERERKLTDAAYERTQEELRDSSPEERQELLARLRELRQKQEQIADRLKRASPRYGALRYPQPLDLSGIRAVLDPGTLLLAYSVGKGQSQLFAIAADSRRGPPLSVFTLTPGEKTLRESVRALRKLIEWGEPSPELRSRAHELYDALLKPAEALIARSDRVLFVPDGPLHTLPWAALLRELPSGGAQFLVEWRPVSTALSATVYAELKRQRRPATATTIDVAAFGDPKYPTLAERKLAVKRSEAEPPAEDGDLDHETLGDAQLRSVLRGGFRFDPLPATRQEVEQIVQLYAPKAAAYLGADATEERAKAIGKDVPLVHFACHALLNSRFPLDSALVFTIPEHPREGQDNGLLQAWEIFEKVRIDADLVTLSACESGLGKEMAGEGLIGLTRAFQYAGARSVLASLWKVEDKATGELMKRFYANLKAGKPKDEALRLAQIDMIHSPDLARPIDWAAFQLNGDWK